MAKTTASRKSKGRRLQQMVCKELAELAGLSYGKDEDIASREMSQTGPDCRMSLLARKLLGITVEAKNQERWNLDKFVKQAKENCYPDTDWVLVLSKNYLKRPLVVIDWSFFKTLLTLYVSFRKEKNNL